MFKKIRRLFRKPQQHHAWPGRKTLPVEELSNAELYSIGRDRYHPRQKECIRALQTRWAIQSRRNEAKSRARLGAARVR